MAVRRSTMTGGGNTVVRSVESWKNTSSVPLRGDEESTYAVSHPSLGAVSLGMASASSLARSERCAASFCAVGVVWYCSHKLKGDPWVEALVLRAISEAAETDEVMEWNDAPSRTAEDVIATMLEAARHIREDRIR